MQKWTLLQAYNATRDTAFEGRPPAAHCQTQLLVGGVLVWLHAYLPACLPAVSILLPSPCPSYTHPRLIHCYSTHQSGCARVVQL